MERKFKSVICTPGGWTHPGSYYVASKEETQISQPKDDVLQERCKKVLSNADHVLRIIDPYLNQIKKRRVNPNNAIYSFMVTPEDGFLWFNKHNIEGVIEQDPKTQIDIY